MKDEEVKALIKSHLSLKKRKIDLEKIYSELDRLSKLTKQSYYSIIERYGGVDNFLDSHFKKKEPFPIAGFLFGIFSGAFLAFVVGGYLWVRSLAPLYTIDGDKKIIQFLGGRFSYSFDPIIQNIKEAQKEIKGSIDSSNFTSLDMISSEGNFEVFATGNGKLVSFSCFAQKDIDYQYEEKKLKMYLPPGHCIVRVPSHLLINFESESVMLYMHGTLQNDISVKFDRGMVNLKLDNIDEFDIQAAMKDGHLHLDEGIELKNTSKNKIRKLVIEGESGLIRIGKSKD